MRDLRTRLARWLAPWLGEPVPGVLLEAAAPARCNWCHQHPNTDCPRMAVEAHFIIRGDSDDEVLREIRHFPSWLAAVSHTSGGLLPQGWVREDGVEMDGSMTDGRRSVYVHRRDITPEQYRAEADAWLERQFANGDAP